MASRVEHLFLWIRLKDQLVKINISLVQNTNQIYKIKLSMEIGKTSHNSWKWTLSYLKAVSSEWQKMVLTLKWIVLDFNNSVISKEWETKDILFLAISIIQNLLFLKVRTFFKLLILLYKRILIIQWWEKQLILI